MSDYVLRVSERQLRLISRMAELYGRVAIGEFEAVADTVRCLSPADSRAARRNLDEAKQLLTGLPERARHRPDSHLVDEDARVALDLHEDLSRELARNWCTAGAMSQDRPPQRHSLAEPPVTVERDLSLRAVEPIAA